MKDPFHLTIARWLALLLMVSSTVSADERVRQIRMANDPSVSPDGDKIAFSWLGEIWTADIDGKNLRRLTSHEARDSQPLFSPDGKQLAFVSDRTGSSQIFVMQADGSAPRQVTYHSEGYALEDWFPDGRALLASGSRDHFHRDANRLIKVDLTQRRAEQILADAMAEDAKLSPDGKRILFTREGERWWRKGYRGERSSQVWQLDLQSGQFQELLHEGVECMWPLWMADGNGFYFTKGATHGFDLWQYLPGQGDPAVPEQTRVAGFEDDSIVYPAISRDGETIVFRHLFDLYSLHPGTNEQPQRIDFVLDQDVDLPRDELRRELSSASDVAFTEDGLEVALIVGGDVWVMDTKLSEPQRVTATAGYEQDICFSLDGEALYFTSIVDGKADIRRATRKDTEKYWWQNTEFDVEQITDDMHIESDLRLTPDGKQLVFQQGRGDLVVMQLETKTKRTLLRGFSGIDYDLSSDGRWIAYSQQDDDFNREIWIAPLSGESKPVNVSRHPDNDSDPRFSPDGKILAFTGRRVDREVDIYYVYLQQEQDQMTSRQRLMDEALELMKKKRKAETSPAAPKNAKSDDKGSSAATPETGSDDTSSEKKGENQAEATEGDPKEVKPIQIDLQDIHQRLRQISIPDSYEGDLLFSPDGKKLLFSASIDSKRGWYTVEFPDELTPKLLSTSTGSSAVWSEKAGGILYLRSGSPAKLDANGKLDSYSFEVAQQLSRSGWLQAGFDQAWLTMREVWYDERFANKNWDAIRRKYASVAAQMFDTGGLADVVELMLGELNGSHLGFTPSGAFRRTSVDGWADETPHLGVRFQESYQGPGLLVRDVIPDSPADRQDSKLLAGDIILAIDRTPVDPALDLTELLNGRLDRDIHLRIARKTEAQAEATELDITLRPISFGRARSLLYERWLESNRQAVEQASKGQLGYLHIRAMDMDSFHEFERELYNVGYGREGLVIDVRDNGGGSTTDLLLTALTQPRHAITVPRGGGQGYPQDRAVFASWAKPIIVLCNQNSYSNAEIFSHAIKSLGRGKIVGVQTAGGVVSTGSATINDVGQIRVPFRGWFVIGTGQDMELNGCLPDEVVWPAPGELPSGVDRQLQRAVELLLLDVGDGEATRELIYAAER